MNALLDIPPFLDRRPLVWSFSMLKAFRNCSFKGNEQYIRRALPYVESVEQKRGNEIHKAFELRVGGGKPLPQDMQKWEKFAAPLDGLGAKTEVQLGVTAEGKSCGFFDKNVAGRGKLDVVVIQGDRAYLPDWKHANPLYEDRFELDVNAVLLHSHYPHLKKIVGQYVWLRDSHMGELYDLSDTASTWKEIWHRHTNIMNMRKIDDFPKNPSGLCGWCKVNWCEHNPEHR